MYVQLHYTMYNHTVTAIIIIHVCTMSCIIVNHTCTGNNTEVEITTRDYQPGQYNAIFNLTDIYGQTVQLTAPLFLTCMFIFKQFALI